jgi:hypothetical protein
MTAMAWTISSKKRKLKMKLIMMVLPTSLMKMMMMFLLSSNNLKTIICCSNMPPVRDSLLHLQLLMFNGTEKLSDQLHQLTKKSTISLLQFKLKQVLIP